jgi:hypothetical protein
VAVASGEVRNVSSSLAAAGFLLFDEINAINGVGGAICAGSA